MRKCSHCEQLSAYKTMSYCKQHLREYQEKNREQINEWRRNLNSKHYTYKITNLQLGTIVYFGSTCQKNRWYYHKRVALKHYDQGFYKKISKHIREYGVDNFKFEILEYYTSKEEAREAETKLIQKHIGELYQKAKTAPYKILTFLNLLISTYSPKGETKPTL